MRKYVPSSARTPFLGTEFVAAIGFVIFCGLAISVLPLILIGADLGLK